MSVFWSPLSHPTFSSETSLISRDTSGRKSELEVRMSDSHWESLRFSLGNLTAIVSRLSDLNMFDISDDTPGARDSG